MVSRFLFNERSGQLQPSIGMFRSQEPVMPDTDISRRQDMGKEAAYKFHGRQLDLLMCSRALVIPDTEGNPSGIGGKKSLVGYGHPMGIVAEI